MPMHLQQTLTAAPEAIYHNLTDTGRLAGAISLTMSVK